MKILFGILSFSFFVPFLYSAEDIKQKENEINKIEQELRTKVSEYNKMIAEKQSGKKKDDHPVDSAKKPKAVESDKKDTPCHLNISSDTNILQEQVKQLQDTVENLSREVKELKEYVVLKKKAKIDGIAQKSPENDPQIIEYTSSQAQFNAANALFQKDTEEGYKKAIESFECVAQENLNHSVAYSAYNKIGDSYRKLAKWDEAIKYYNVVIEEDQAKIYQRVDAFLGRADAEREKNDRITACKTLDALERSNLPMTKEQKERYQSLIVNSDCASKKDHDIKEEKTEKLEQKSGEKQ